MHSVYEVPTKQGMHRDREKNFVNLNESCSLTFVEFLSRENLKLSNRNRNKELQGERNVNGRAWRPLALQQWPYAKRNQEELEEPSSRQKPSGGCHGLLGAQPGAQPGAARSRQQQPEAARSSQEL